MKCMVCGKYDAQGIAMADVREDYKLVRRTLYLCYLCKAELGPRVLNWMPLKGGQGESKTD